MPVEQGNRSQLGDWLIRGLADFSRDKVKICQIAQTIHSSFCREKCLSLISQCAITLLCTVTQSFCTVPHLDSMVLSLQTWNVK